MDTGGILALGGGVIVAMLLMCLLIVGAQVALAFCVYYDSKLCGFEYGVLWAVLSGFSTLAALVYLIYRCCNRNKPMLCPYCRQWVARDYRFCPHCGQAHLVDGAAITPDQEASFVKRRKTLFILWLVALCVSVLLIVATTLFIVFTVLRLGSTTIMEITPYLP